MTPSFLGENQDACNEDDYSSMAEFSRDEEDRHGNLWGTEGSITPMTSCPHFSLSLSTPPYHSIDFPKFPMNKRCHDEVNVAELSLLFLTLDHKDDMGTLNQKDDMGSERTCLTVSTCSSNGGQLQSDDVDLGIASKKSYTFSSIGMSSTYGTINAIIILPILLSFGSIIYRDDAFAPYMHVLIKLTLVSGIVHQVCFSTLSSLPIAVGQVQDAGLIFLSSMASSLV